MALAQSIAEYIHDICRARTIFSTHYHELARLALAKPALNLRMKCGKKAGNRFLYKVGEGAADRSYGIHVARLPVYLRMFEESSVDSRRSGARNTL